MRLGISKNFKHFLDTVPEEEFKKDINLVIDAINKIFEFKSTNANFRKIYEVVFRLVANKKEKELHRQVKQAIEKHTRSIGLEINQKNNNTFLHEMLGVWEKFRKAISCVKELLLYMDEKHDVKSNEVLKDKDTVKSFTYNESITTFKEIVLTSVFDRLRDLIIQIITDERNGEKLADKFLLKNLAHMMIEVDKKNIYQNLFEKEFLEETHTYYKREAQKNFDSSSAVDYLKKVKKRLQEERERSERCFHAETIKKVENVLKEELIFNYSQKIVEKKGTGVTVMLNNKKLNDLKILYQVFGNVSSALKPTIEAIKHHVLQKGLEVVRDPKYEERPTELVGEVIKLRVYFDYLLYESFSKQTETHRIRDKEASRAVKEAFDIIVNENERFVEYLSLLLDMKMKKGSTAEEPLEAFFDHCVMVFRHVREKDVFEVIYKKHLANRLLSGSTSSDDDEKTFLGKLKAEFGYQFTSKLEGMFKDIKVSKELNNKWKQYESSKNLEMEMSVKVLTSVNWPNVTQKRINILAPYMSKGCEEYEKFYLSEHSGRKISWQFNMGNLDVVANGFLKKYEFNVSTYQSLILLLFNEKNTEIPLKEMCEKLNLPISDVVRNLKYLLLPLDKKEKSSKVLMISKKHSKDELVPIDGNLQKSGTKAKKKLTLTPETVIVPNEKFKCNKLKHKIQYIQKKQDNEERQQTDKTVMEERKWSIDAVIVRIMKMRKTLKHNELIQETMEQLTHRFPLAAQLIKSRIEVLIERDYLERSETERNLYIYVA